jgi:hypothetical protein
MESPVAKVIEEILTGTKKVRSQNVIFIAYIYVQKN